MSVVYDTELDTIFKSKHSGHFWKDGDNEEEVQSIFASDIRVIGWSSHQQLPFIQGNSTSSGVVPYSMCPGYHKLMSSYIIFTLPEISVKEKCADTVQIAWTQEIGYVVANEAKLRWNSVELQSLSKHSCVIAGDYYSLPGHEKRQKADVGNVKKLTKWNTFLPSYSVQPTLPWYYSTAPYSAIRLDRAESKLDSIVHTFQYCLSIAKLLRMRKLVDDKWVNVKVDLSFLSGVPVDGNLKVPEMYGEFSGISPAELNHLSCTDSGDEMSSNEIFYVRDFKTRFGGNTRTNGETETVKFDGNHLYTSLHWAAINVTAEDLNDHCNYSTEFSDSKNGSHPILTSSLEYSGSLSKFSKMRSEHFGGPSTRGHFSTSNYRVGVNSIALTPDPKAYSVVGGVMLGQHEASLQCEIASKTSNNSYKLVTVAVATRRGKYVKGKSEVVMDS